MSRKPVILLGMYQVNDLYKLFVRHLEQQGFQVVDISYSHTVPPFRYPSWRKRMGCFLHKKILRRQGAKERLIKETRSRHFANIHRKTAQKIERYESFDYALIMGGQIYPKHILERIKQKTTGIMAAYQWDGLDRFPEIWERIDIFDKVYAFDPQDNRRYSDKVLPATNFYFETETCNNAEPQCDFYFLGSHVPELGRANAVSNFFRYATEKGWTADFTIFHVNSGSLNEHTDVYPAEIKATSQPLSFAENIRREQQSRVILDFKAAVHSGLSFRTIEAVGYRKKLITTNPEVAKYDFYHPDNIYIWDGKTFDGIEAFLARPYRELPPEIYRKYSFSNWLHYILDLAPHQKITLPE